MKIEPSRTELEQAVFDLWLWRTTDSTSFSSQLYSLFCKADITNQMRLEKGFPAQTAAYREWQRAASEERFFRRWNINTLRIIGGTDYESANESFRCESGRMAGEKKDDDRCF